MHRLGSSWGEKTPTGWQGGLWIYIGFYEWRKKAKSKDSFNEMWKFQALGALQKERSLPWAQAAQEYVGYPCGSKSDPGCLFQAEWSQVWENPPQIFCETPNLSLLPGTPCTRSMKGLKWEGEEQGLGWKGSGEGLTKQEILCSRAGESQSSSRARQELPSPPAPADYPDGVMMIQGQELYFLYFPLSTAADHVLIIGTKQGSQIIHPQRLKDVLFFCEIREEKGQFWINVCLWRTQGEASSKQPECSAAKSKSSLCYTLIFLGHRNTAWNPKGHSWISIGKARLRKCTWPQPEKWFGFISEFSEPKDTRNVCIIYDPRGIELGWEIFSCHLLIPPQKDTAQTFKQILRMTASCSPGVTANFGALLDF